MARRSKKRKHGVVKTGIKVKPVTVEVENPYFNPSHPEDRTNPKTIQAIKNERECSLFAMRQRNQITAAQFKAGEQFRALYEKAEGGAVKALDWTLERVDGGGRSDPIHDSQVEAHSALSEVQKVLGQFSYKLVRAVAGERFTIGQYAAQYVSKTPNEKKRRKEYLGRRMRDALEELAEHWGY